MKKITSYWQVRGPTLSWIARARAALRARIDKESAVARTEQVGSHEEVDAP